MTMPAVSRVNQRTPLAQSASRAAFILAGASIVLLATGCESKPAAPPQMGPLPVSVVTVQPSDVALNNQWVGTLDGFVNAQIQPQVTGYLIRQDYREGSVVSKGQVLFEIDPRPFQATLDQAKGQVASAEAALGQAQAALKLAEINVTRDTPLAEQKAIAQSQLDQEVQTKAQNEANVQQAKAQIAAARAAEETATINLGFTKVRSLISGVAGQAVTQIGNLVSPQTALTSVSQLDPVKVFFSISDSEYLALMGRNGGTDADLLKNAGKVPLTLTLANGDTYPHKGKIAFIDRQMNQQTGAIRIAAVFPNPNNLLRPGQFGRVSANTEIRRNAITVPQVAVTDTQGMKQVFTVDANNKVHVVTVQVGAESGKDFIITSGLASGSRVVVDNLQKLKEGVPVAPHAPAPASATPAEAR
ncbi:efflux RND transporter periplasmic adaptor subunit [Terriglobus roseus]|uniref:Membrane fusion protein, multidrug efflux system n=1 Tax=Terriglobus roseus TaxID=392734 RepID=A0A1G7IP25_9BACT|nr:efflux RND transporter periplasmic adaptor subunit [Terriglobus roseus]SDF14500.1 membrane fusion protein, multidrug efflux system [Terriglobus roseus]